MYKVKIFANITIFFGSYVFFLSKAITTKQWQVFHIILFSSLPFRAIFTQNPENKNTLCVPQTAIANELFNLNNYWPCRQAGQLVFPLSIVVNVEFREHRLRVGDMSGLCRLLHEKEW